MSPGPVLLLVALGSCHTSDSLRESPSPTPVAPAAVQAILSPRFVPPIDLEAVRALDIRAAAAAAAHDAAALSTMAAGKLDVHVAAQEVSPSECVGDLMELKADTRETAMSRRVLGYSNGLRCEGVHELLLSYAVVDGQPRLTGVTRYGW
jgi:hypothetical protein